MSLRTVFRQTLSRFSSSTSSSPALGQTTDETDFDDSAKLLRLLDSTAAAAEASDEFTQTPAMSSDTLPSGSRMSDRALRSDGGATGGGLRLAQALLADVVRPAFSRDRHREVTAAGRRAIEQTYRPPVPYDGDETMAGKPWKYEERWVVGVFGWCLDRLDTNSVEPNWPLLIPPILSTIDDIDTPWRIRGCGFLRKLLSLCPPAFLRRTGIGEVFEQALFPCLQHLPPLTEETETIKLLSVVYPTLLELVNSRREVAEKATEKDKLALARVLDRIVRSEILKALHSVSDNVAISTVLLEQLSVFAPELGVACVKHLKLIIPSLTERLTSPFLTAAPAYLRTTAMTLKTVQLQAWPRIPYYSLQILSGICIAWCRIVDEEVSGKTELESSKRELCENVEILNKIMSAANENPDECKQILASDSRLAELYQLWSG